MTQDALVKSLYRLVLSLLEPRIDVEPNLQLRVWYADRFTHQFSKVLKINPPTKKEPGSSLLIVDERGQKQLVNDRMYRHQCVGPISEKIVKAVLIRRKKHHRILKQRFEASHGPVKKGKK